LTRGDGFAIVAPMTELKPATASSDLGVVDPLRIPGAVAARRIWRGLPPLAQAFIGLATLDVIIRALGLFGTELFLFLDNPLSWFTAFFPHDALILLPAVVVVRRRDALEATPLVVRGAVAIALVEMLSAPSRNLVSGSAPDPVIAPTVVSILALLVSAGGWFWIAQGLKVLNPVRTAESAAGLANLVAGALVVAALANLGLALFAPQPDIGNATWTSLFQLNSAMLAVPALAFAYLARETLLGTGDLSRPYEARWLATAGLVLFAIGTLLFLVGGQGVLWVLIGFVTGPVAMTSFVVAFGLGLADPSGTIEPAVQTEQRITA
jgi:hypothetical protein